MKTDKDTKIEMKKAELIGSELYEICQKNIYKYKIIDVYGFESFMEASKKFSTYHRSMSFVLIKTGTTRRIDQSLHVVCTKGSVKIDEVDWFTKPGKLQAFLHVEKSPKYLKLKETKDYKTQLKQLQNKHPEYFL